MSSSTKRKSVSLSPSVIIGLSLACLDSDGDSDVNSSLTTSDGEYDSEVESEVVSGAFRWSELAKFSDASPGAVFRKRAAGATRKNKKADTTKPSKDDKTPQTPRRTSTELGERISLLVNSPTNSPRSVMAGHRKGMGRKTLK